MRCLLCHNFSFIIVCKKCQFLFLQPRLSVRVIEGGLKVYSFYKYSDIATLLKTKHTHVGVALYNILAQNTLKIFAEKFSFTSVIDVVPIDDIPKSGYAHTAILARNLRTKYLLPYYGAMRAQNNISYSAKSLQYRLEHPRDFMKYRKRNENVILVDDIITTGTTINEAKNEIVKSGAMPLFALTLADASDL